MKIIALVLTIGATFSWASAQIIGKIVLRDIQSLVFNTIRFTTATVPIALAVLLFGSFANIKFGLPFLSAVASGALGWFVATSIYFFVLKRDLAHRIIPAGNAYPFWAILAGVLLLGEGITYIIPVSAALVFLGSFLLSRSRDKEDDKEEDIGLKYGVPVASLVAFLWGMNAVFIKFALNGGMSSLSVLLVRIISATVLFWIAITLKKQDFNISKRSLGLSALSGLIASSVGSLLYVTALTYEEASTLAPVTGSTILFGFTLSIIFLGETPTKKAILGMLSIFGGIILMAL